MSTTYILPDEPVPDFHARVKRRSRGRAIGAKHEKRLAMRRIVVLASAMAVPAFAAPDGLHEARPTTAIAAPAVKPMGFEIPGESFPGSAFYYLEDPPRLRAAEHFPAGEDIPATPDLATSETFNSGPLNSGPVARAMMSAGSGSDRSRAQQCMTMAIYYEAASESDAGQRAVAQVVLNRVAHSAWPRTVCGVVFQGSERQTGCQFSFTCDGSLARKPSPAFWNRASRVARQALAGFVYAPVGLSTHYHTLAVNPHWASSLDQTTVIGAHQFYRMRGSAGKPAAFAGLYSGGEPMPARTSGISLAIAAQDRADPRNGGLHASDPVASLQPVPDAAPTLPAIVAQAPQNSNNLPSSGTIRSEYSRSGTWRQDFRQPAGSSPSGSNLRK